MELPEIVKFEHDEFYEMDVPEGAVASVGAVVIESQEVVLELRPGAVEEAV